MIGGYVSYYFEKGQFIIEDYDQKSPFSSFLPGISGVKGVPLWAFYANRGQGITSLGIGDKDEPIIEFFPANTSYQYVDKYGFRSFVKIDREIYEPFSIRSEDCVKRKMSISKGLFSIVEENFTRKISYKVTYCGLANEPLAGLIRRVEVKNHGESRDIEILDGVANVLPSGATNESFKNMSNLMVSWMAVENLENHIPFFKFRASSGDQAEISVESKGHFYFSFNEDQALIKPIVDLDLIFAYDTSLSNPVGLEKELFTTLSEKDQVLFNKVPCAFTPLSKNLVSEEELVIHTLIGHASDVNLINKKSIEMASRDYMTKKIKESESVIEELTHAVETQTNFPIFDAYIQQNFLDNMLRGGYPLVFGEGDRQKIYHVYSRKHGDPERDYNFFKLSAEFYSQGNGNFRDINQNRRCDVFFVPEAGLFNIKMFMNLIQLDGYNPLNVQGTTFSIDEMTLERILDQYILSGREHMKKILSQKFTPGQVSMAFSLSGIKAKLPEVSFIHILLGESKQHIEANYGEGYWIDHWTYNYDLIESFLSVYPDQVESLLYDDASYQYYVSPVKVLPRRQKWGVNSSGLVRQYGALEEKEHITERQWLRDKSGEIYQTHLMQKLFTLVLTKFSTLDPFGMGIEMEANKPGWNDAMNGLPGVMGSGLSETIELLRLIRFLKPNVSRDFFVLEENAQFYGDIKGILSLSLTTFERWDSLSTARERYRAVIDQGIKGSESLILRSDFIFFLKQAEMVIEEGIARAKKLNGDILPTYFSYRASEFEVLDEYTPYGLKAVNVKAFEREVVPIFLEAPARYFKIGSFEENQKNHHAVKHSKLYDASLKLYKTSESLENMSFELGRIRAFTPGWLERESNFMHMTYKYLLGLLKAGLYDCFYEEIKSQWVCFMEPEIYGRSTLENSSFIASSSNPNPRIHGRGFVARLSGSTSEMLNMWCYMMFGKSIFKYDGELEFAPEPILHESFFKDGKVETTLFSKIRMIIVNSTGLSTYSPDLKVDYYLIDGEKYPCVRGNLALKIRMGKVREIKMFYKRMEVDS